VSRPAIAPDCVFCRIVADAEPASVVHEDANTLAFMNLRQSNPGHVLVVPRRHLVTFDELDDDLAAHLARAVVRVARGVRDAFGATGYNVFQNNGAAAGQDVFHLHVHILPRWENDGVRLVHPVVPVEPRARLDALAAQIRATLVGS
jgi:histidine triad (HIT) family protein